MCFFEDDPFPLPSPRGGSGYICGLYVFFFHLSFIFIFFPYIHSHRGEEG